MHEWLWKNLPAGTVTNQYVYEHAYKFVVAHSFKLDLKSNETLIHVRINVVVVNQQNVESGLVCC